MSGEELAQQLWGRGLEVRLDAAGAPLAIRTFRGDVTGTGLEGQEVRPAGRSARPSRW